MRKEFLPFSKPTFDDDDINAIGEVLRSGWITTGRHCAEFEKEFGDYVGAEGRAIALSSATGGMHLALKALNIGPGDEVITASMTWVSTVNMIVLAGATPVFADINRDTMMISAETIEPLITRRTRAIIPVHFAGAAADMVPIRKLAGKHGIHIIEDAAHAVGTEYRGARIGAEGITIFSFHPIKNITTGEGGMFCADDPALLDRVRRLKFHGLGVDAFDRRTQGRSPQAEVLEPGFKYNLTDIAAVLGRRQLARLDEFNQRRTELAGYYTGQLAEIPEIIPLAIPDYPIKHAWHLFIARLDTDRTGINRDEFMKELKCRNIGSGLHFRAVHLQSYYHEQMGFKRGLLPHTEWNSDRICSLPLFPGMRKEDIDDVVTAIKEVLRP